MKRLVTVQFPSGFPDDVVESPVAEVKPASAGGGTVVSMDSPLVIPKSYQDDRLVGVRRSDLAIARESLEVLAKEKPGWRDLLLGIATTLLGWSLSQFSSCDPGSVPGVLSAVIPLFVSAVLFAVYACQRIIGRDRNAFAVQRAYERIPDPDQAEEIRS